MERDPDVPDTGDVDLFGDADDVDESIEEQLDERLQAEQEADED
jgi:hypothetical protein